MDTIDSIKRLLGELFPKEHRFIILGLAGFLFVLSTNNDLSNAPLTSRFTASTISEVENTEPDSVLKDFAALDSSLPDSAALILPETTSSSTDISLTTIPQIEEQVSEAFTPDFVTEVKSGDNLSLIFNRAGLNARDVYEISNSEPKASILSNLYPGYQLEFTFTNNSDHEKELAALNIIKNKLESVEFSRDIEGSYITTENFRQPDIRQVFREATIDDSLFLAAKRGGMSAGVTMELAGIFGGVIDFLLDTRKGDTFNLLYEEKYIDGEYIGYGAIKAAQFTNQGETFTAVRYNDKEGISNFYNPEGESMRKAFLRNPVDFTRISDSFNLRRKHPILNTIRAHKGTDYAAPRGTPVVAAGDGRVTWASRNGSFGKLVVVQHGEKFQTKYAHLNTYAKGVKKGSRVRQGQVIGYVGSTGGATGPHLHYEFLMDGVHRNSRTIHDKLPKAESVPNIEMQRFKEQTQIILAQLETHVGNTNNIALNTLHVEQ